MILYLSYLLDYHLNHIIKQHEEASSCPYPPCCLAQELLLWRGYLQGRGIVILKGPGLGCASSLGADCWDKEKSSRGYFILHLLVKSSTSNECQSSVYCN